MVRITSMKAILIFNCYLFFMNNCFYLILMYVGHLGTSTHKTACGTFCLDRLPWLVPRGNVVWLSSHYWLLHMTFLSPSQTLVAQSSQ